MGLADSGTDGLTDARTATLALDTFSLSELSFEDRMGRCDDGRPSAAVRESKRVVYPHSNLAENNNKRGF
jgi:hypothetical protein